MEPIRFRVMLRNGPDHPAFSGAERAVILLGEKVLGDFSMEPMRTERGVILFSLRFAVPGFRLRKTDAPLVEQQDELTTRLFGEGRVERSDDAVAIYDGDRQVGKGDSWEEAFRRSLPNSRAFAEVIDDLRRKKGTVAIQADSLSTHGVKAVQSLGARKVLDDLYEFSALGAEQEEEGWEEVEEPAARSSRPSRPRSQTVSVEPVDVALGLMTPTQRSAYDHAIKMGQPQLAEKLRQAVLASKATTPIEDDPALSMMTQEERDSYLACLKAGRTELAERLRQAVLASRSTSKDENAPISARDEASCLPFLSDAERETYLRAKQVGRNDLARRLLLAVVTAKLRERGRGDLADALLARGI